MILAITGYVGAGKTTVAELFGQNGYVVINVDRIGHEMLRSQSVKDKIIAAFGMDILGRDLEVDRDKLRRIVFNDDAKLRILDEIVHPYIKEDLDKTIAGQERNIVIDVALFRELGVCDVCEKTILVKADLEQVYIRLQERYSKEEVLAIMNAQDIITDADIVIENNGTKEDLKQKVIEIISTLP